MADVRVTEPGTKPITRRQPRRSQVLNRVLDIGLGLIGAYAAVILTLEVTADKSTVTRISAVLLAALYGGAIAFRRVALRSVVVVQLAAAIGYVALGLQVYMLGPAILVTAYTLGSRLPRRIAVRLLAVVQAALAVLLFVGSADVSTWLLYAVILVAAWFLGDVARQWRDAAAAHAQHAAELEQAREELARLAVTAERVRIARELHDVVAHSMSVIAMHAATGRLALHEDQAAAERALQVVEQSSRDALAEMRRLVTILREADQSRPVLTPAPGLRDVHRLVAEIAAAGVSVQVRTEGDLDNVPEGVSLAAYRIVQEALTNVVRHASPTEVHLSVTTGAGEVVIDVSDDGATPPRQAVLVSSGTGLGMVGMRERAALYGGDVTAGPRPEGGWRVKARLPYPEADQ